MFTERFFVEGLAHASYLFGSDGEAAVVDPKRDVDDYIRAAERHGAKIVAIFETHPHADFVSGHLELSERADAVIYVSDQLEAAYPHRALADGDQVRIGSLKVTALHTPGHSPDSMSFHVEGGEIPNVYTGDTLFVGDVGRPDLRDATADPRAMAEALHDTLFDVLFRLPGETVVYPAHGAGSLCGRKIGTAPQTTIGAEKRDNWAVRFPDRDAFVEAMLSNLPDRPAYFSYDVGRNQRGAGPLSKIPKPEPIGIEDLFSAGPDPLVIDTRAADEYGAGHLAGSLNIGIASPMFSTWAGFFVDPESPVVLVVGRGEDVGRAWLELARIGYENVRGYLLADPSAWERAGLDVRRTTQMDVCDVKDWLKSGNALVDVRTAGEWNEDHIEGAVWIPLPTFPQSVGQVPKGNVAVICGSGYRSSLAASLLERAGRVGTVNVSGGWSAWVERPCVEPDASDVLRREKIAA